MSCLIASANSAYLVGTIHFVGFTAHTTEASIKRLVDEPGETTLIKTASIYRLIHNLDTELHWKILSPGPYDHGNYY